MFFVLSKILDVVFSPLWWPAMALGLSRIPWLTKRVPRLLKAQLALACALTLFCATQVGSQILQHAVERGAPRTMRDGVTYDAVIVLSGFVSDEAMRRYPGPSYGDPADRMLAAFDLLRSDRARAAILTGGGPGDPAWTEAAVMRRQLTAWGVDPARLYEEPRARNTRENAVESARIANAQGFRTLLLVTSAAHMERSLASFRAVGLAVDTYPVDYRVGGWVSERWALLPRAGNLEASEVALREFFGRLVYRARGYAR